MTSRMTSRGIALALTVLGAASLLAACETTDVRSASADQPLKRACQPGPTPAGTRSGLACDTGSSTGAPSGSDANVEGAASTGSAAAQPSP